MSISKNGLCTICQKPLYKTDIEGVYVCHNTKNTSRLTSSHINVLKLEKIVK